MQYRSLGRSGLKVSEIAYGNWITHASQVEEHAALACVATALEHGVTTFDTADVYAAGRAETVLGKALRGVRRESVQISTKVFWPSGPGANDRSLSRKHIVESAHASLRRLGTDYLDLYQAHRYDHDTPLEETLRAFDDLVRQGKVLYIGVSEWRAEQIAAAVRAADQMGLDRIVSNQPQYNIIWRVIESEVIPLSQRVGVGQAVWSPLAQGVLSGKYLANAKPPTASRASSATMGQFIQSWLRPGVLDAVQALKPIAKEAGCTLSQFSLAWVLREPNVASAIVGASKPEQLEENVVSSGLVIDPDLFRQAEAIVASVKRGT